MNKHCKSKEFVELLNVFVITLQRWYNSGKLKAFRTPTNRKYYTYKQYLEYIGVCNEDNNGKVVIYARVSTYNQKDDKIINKSNSFTDGIGIDLGIKKLAVCSDGNKFKYINKTYNIKKVEKRLKENEENFQGNMKV